MSAPAHTLDFFCAQCKAPSPPFRCCDAHYCNRACQKKHFPLHKSTCIAAVEGSRVPLYAPEVLDDLQKALPEFTILDGSHVRVEELPGWVQRLEAAPNTLLVVVRRRSGPTARLFEITSVNVASAVLGMVSAILIYWKDNFFHMRKEPLPALVQFIRQQTTKEAAADCMVCMQTLDTLFGHRAACGVCGTTDVCNACVEQIKASHVDGLYSCPACRTTPERVYYKLDADTLANGGQVVYDKHGKPLTLVSTEAIDDLGGVGGSCAPPSPP